MEEETQRTVATWLFALVSEPVKYKRGRVCRQLTLRALVVVAEHLDRLPEQFVHDECVCPSVSPGAVLVSILGKFV